MSQTIPPTITAAPTPAPQRNDRTTFSSRVDAFVTWVSSAVAQFGAVATNVYDNAVDAYNSTTTAATQATNANNSAIAASASASTATTQATNAANSAASAAAIAGAFVGTSVTSWTPALGSKAFTTQSGEQYTNGIYVSVVSASTPSAWGVGQVSSYTGTTLTVDVQVKNGSGAYTDWNISLTGTPGPTGVAGPESLPTASAGGTVDAITAIFSPAITLSDQQKCCVVLAGANATTTPTFSPNSLTVRTIKKKGGQALAIGDLPGAGALAIFIYNLAGAYWELANPQGTSTTPASSIIYTANFFGAL